MEKNDLFGEDGGIVASNKVTDKEFFEKNYEGKSKKRSKTLKTMRN